MNIFKTYRKTSLFFLIIFILVGGLYWAVDYSHKFTPEEIASLEKQAESGDAESMYMLGSIYDLGEGVPVNYEIAKKYYELAIKKEYPEAFHRLGSLYWNGDGVKQNRKTAISYFEQAAEQGASATFVLLGLLYFYGVEVEKNYFIAFEYMQKASDLGVVDAYMFMGNMYLEGLGVDKNIAKAKFYYDSFTSHGKPFLESYISSQLNLLSLSF